jgi:NADH dehydrogenase
MMKIRREFKKIKTRERILYEALSLFEEKGYAETTVHEITERAGVAKGTFFNYFSTKEELLKEVEGAKVKSLLDFIISGPVSTLPIDQKLSIILTRLFVLYDLVPDLTPFTNMNQEVFEVLKELFLNVAVQGQRRGEITQFYPAATVASLFMNIFIGAISQPITMNKAKLLNSISTQWNMVLNGLKPIKEGVYKMKKLVVLGGGYGGVRVIQSLLSSKYLPDDLKIILVDRMPFHGLKTEYYALAAGTESEIAIRVPFPTHERLTIHYGEVEGIRLDERQVLLRNQEPIQYDLLIIGLGCTDNYHNVPGAREYTFGIQSLSAARRAYQKLNDVRPYGQITVVGGGLSGVELAAEMREARPDLNIRIIDRGPSILGPFPERLKKYVRAWFVDHDVELVPNSNVESVHEWGLINNGNEVLSDCIVWTAGIKANEVLDPLPLEKDRIGRLIVTPHHHLPNYPEVFVVGDCAALPQAPSAQLAEAQGEQIAEVLIKRWKNQDPGQLPTIKLKGILGSLGKKEGFGMMGDTSLIGRIPRVLKSGVLWMYRHHNG